ncbi:RES family NAD+ phosphorylase [Acidisoma cladoniae]|jgi:RES domain-containing protein|uniref:RES family NAD+ phosphorylase n=1 Tax=Acidisoma cladoniae TaxID=3040935 RepID=UPI00254A8A85|nr:RES family NAD+ phosphorylase [Acidisoma sp. PAMC 29798]
MLAWRICRKPFADIGGDGARLYGGRWNTPGRPVLYCGSTAALAVLEVRVHLDLPPELLPADYVLMTIDLNDLAIEDVMSWPSNPQAFGDEWLRDQRTPLLRVPSAIVPESTNIVLNVAHPAAAGAAIVEIRPFAFDQRLWLPLRPA